jgi:AraC-like DNA-binding protein
VYEPGELYLDALFPLAVLSGRRSIRLPPERESTVIVVCRRSPMSVTAPGAGDGTAPGLGAATRTEYGCVWLKPRRAVRVESSGEWWTVVAGRRLLDELVVSAFGEHGFSGFLDELASAPAPVSLDIDRGSAESAIDSCRRLEIELADRRPAFRSNARSLLTELALTIYRAGIETGGSGSEDRTAGGSGRFSAIIDHIEEHFTDELSLPDLAARSAMSTSHFSRTFTRVVGVPVSEYINRRRIREACGMLRRTDRTVTEIALDVGYHNVSFFNRYFRKVMLMSPREYRRYVRG